MSPHEPPATFFDITYPLAWDNYISGHSSPVNDLIVAAGLVQEAARIEIPMRVWSHVLTHPGVQRLYHGLAVSDPHPERCLTCGAVRATFRPVLDRNTFELLLQASAEGPVLPGSIVITDSPENRVLVQGRDPARKVWINTPCHGRPGGVS